MQTAAWSGSPKDGERFTSKGDASDETMEDEPAMKVVAAHPPHVEVRHDHRELVLAITLCAGSAIAQPKDNKAESDKAFFEGLKLVESKDYVGARAKFADAYAKFPSPNSLLNMASTEQLLGQCIDALGHFKAYLALPENPRITPDRKELARQGIASCTSLVARINVKAPPTWPIVATK